MPLNRDFAEALVGAMASSGWLANLSDGALPNPLDLEFVRGNTKRRLIIYARTLTPQRSAESDHHRPAGEMHSQLTFDDTQRGRDKRNTLKFAEDAETLLFGFYHTPDGYVIAAYDPQRHKEYGFSSSLQLKEWKIEEALEKGIALQMRKNGETVVIFHVDEIAEYLDGASALHSLTATVASETLQEETAPAEVKRVFERRYKPGQMPKLMPEERRKASQAITRFTRNSIFERAIKSIYDRCAICGFQYNDVLDAAHIVPVAKGGTDTYDNGLGLCPNCHRMFDNGLVLVDETGKISINPRYVEVLEKTGRAGSLEILRATLRQSLWLPDDVKYHPSPKNLRRMFKARR